jgi:large-conductance mechanosensitive channel
MASKLRSWWQQIKTHPVVSVLIAFVIALVVLAILGGYLLHWDWTGFNGNIKSGKTLWDWMQLLIIPFALAIIAIFFNRAERKNERRIASDNQQETALQEYIKEISELLLHEKLRESQPGDEVRSIARVRTLTVLLRLDKERKYSLLQFLYESGLIEKNESLVKLLGANFSNIDLFRARIREADLSGTTLIEANLGGAYLQGTNLEWANLTRAVLSMSKLNKENLQCSLIAKFSENW